MLNLETLDSLKILIAQVLEQDKFCLVDISSFSQEGRLVLRILVDKICGGITLDECARLNEIIGDVIEREGSIKQSYILEVSSPGLDRPLQTYEDFSRCLNRKVRVFFNQCQDGKYEICGVVISVNETGIDLNTGEQVQRVPFERIGKAKQIIEEVK